MAPHDLKSSTLQQGLPKWQSGKESACQYRGYRRLGFDSWVRKIPWRRKWQPSLAFLPGKFHGQRSLEGYSPWHHKELNMSENACVDTYMISTAAHLVRIY